MSPEPYGERQRSIRVEDKLWNDAKARAADKGETVSHAIRAFLRRYTR